MNMKKLLFAVVCALAFVACKQGKSDADLAGAQLRDSLNRVIEQKDTEINDLMSTMNEIEEGFREINEAENRLSLARDGEGANREQRIRENLQFIQSTMKQNRELIAKLQRQLREGSIKGDQLQRTIENLTKQMEEKDQQLQQLRAELLETTDQENREYYYGPEGGESVKERDGATTTERRDGFGNTVYHERVSAEEDGDSSISITEYEYGGDGRRERRTENSEDYYGGYRANGTHSHESTTVIAYEYDGEGRLSGTTKERTYVEVTRTGTSTGTTIERSEYSYGDGVVTINSHIENSYSSGSSDSWDNEETFEINAYGRKL